MESYALRAGIDDIEVRGFHPARPCWVRREVVCRHRLTLVHMEMLTISSNAQLYINKIAAVKEVGREVQCISNPRQKKGLQASTIAVTVPLHFPGSVEQYLATNTLL